jgi:hypothetical protein
VPGNAYQTYDFSLPGPPLRILGCSAAIIIIRNQEGTVKANAGHAQDVIAMTILFEDGGRNLQRLGLDSDNNGTSVITKCQRWTSNVFKYRKNRVPDLDFF